MIPLLSSDLLSLPELPSARHSRSGDRRELARHQSSADRTSPCAKELQRWIGRWENEGGAAGQAGRLETATNTL